MKPIRERITQPTPEEVRAVRKAAGLTQSQAAALISSAQGKSSYRVWQGYEAEIGLPDHRSIPLSTWELFLLLIGKHPTLKLTQRNRNLKHKIE
jgi:hypothetical protein